MKHKRDLLETLMEWWNVANLSILSVHWGWCSFRWFMRCWMSSLAKPRNPTWWEVAVRTQAVWFVSGFSFQSAFFPINSKHILNFKKHDQKCASSWDYHGIELIHHRLISFPSWLFMTFLTWILQFPGPPGPGPNVHSPHRCHARAQTPGRRQSSRPPGSGTMEFTWTIWEAYGIWMHMGLSWNGGTPIAGWFIMENSIKMIVDDLVALF